MHSFRINSVQDLSVKIPSQGWQDSIQWTHIELFLCTKPWYWEIYTEENNTFPVLLQVIVFSEPSPTSVVRKIDKYINNWNQADCGKCSKEGKQSGSLGKGEINPNTTKGDLEDFWRWKFMLGFGTSSFLWEAAVWALVRRWKWTGVWVCVCLCVREEWNG